MTVNRASLKRHVVRKTATRHVYRDKLTVTRHAGFDGQAVVRGYCTDASGIRTTVTKTVVPESVVQSLPTERVFTERYAPIQQAVFLRFRAWKTLTGKTNGKKRATAILNRVAGLLDLPELNNPDNPDRLDNGIFRLLPKTQAKLDALLELAAENADCLTLSDRM